MKIEILSEPELEFGGGKHHVDIRYGIMENGPVDAVAPVAPRMIRVGIVGPQKNIDGVTEWLTKCRNEIPAKPSRQPSLFPRFPGFRADSCFHAEVALDRRMQRPISDRQFDEIDGLPHHERIRRAVALYVTELAFLVENTTAEVLICAVSERVLAYKIATATESDESADDAHGDAVDDFHDLLKSRAMGLKRPIQLITPGTYGEKRERAPSALEGATGRQLQDEATRAWNLHVALYYKAGGSPWRLVRHATDLATCFVGISFYHTLDRTAIMTSVAQVFNERGDGIVVRGGAARVSKEDRTPHLAEEDAAKLLTSALERYRAEHHNFPARVVLHKSSYFNDAELSGFTRAAKEDLRIDRVELVSIRQTGTRLFRVGQYPTLRGTCLHLDDESSILYSRGSVPFFTTYPGMYVPRPLRVVWDDVEDSRSNLVREILALTKMNWNNTQFDGGFPITLRAAGQVGRVLKYISDGEIEARYSYYM